MDMRSLARWLFDPWLILGMIAFGVLLLASTLFLLWVTRPSQPVDGAPTAVMTVIAAPTATPTTPPPTPTSPVTPTTSANPLPLPPPGDISVGAYIEITGTGGDGLRLRTEPGLNSEVRLLGSESEVFAVRDGPRDVDGYTWWYLEGLADATRRGWAVSNYLRIVQNP